MDSYFRDSSSAAVNVQGVEPGLVSNRSHNTQGYRCQPIYMCSHCSDEIPIASARRVRQPQGAKRKSQLELLEELVDNDRRKTAALEKLVTYLCRDDEN